MKRALVLSVVFCLLITLPVQSREKFDWKAAVTQIVVAELTKPNDDDLAVLGEKESSEMNSKFVARQDPQINQWGLQIAQKAMQEKDCKLKSIPEYWVIDMIENDKAVVNAWAMPGSPAKIYLTEELLKVSRTLGQPYDKVVGSVLAHETGHLARGHIRRIVRKQSRTTGLVNAALSGFGVKSTVGQVAAVVVSTAPVSALSREQEYEADDCILRWTPDCIPGAIALFEYFAKEGPKVPGILAWAKTHPDAADRINHLRSSTGWGVKSEEELPVVDLEVSVRLAADQTTNQVTGKTYCPDQLVIKERDINIEGLSEITSEWVSRRAMMQGLSVGLGISARDGHLESAREELELKGVDPATAGNHNKIVQAQGLVSINLKGCSRGFDKEVQTSQGGSYKHQLEVEVDGDVLVTDVQTLQVYIAADKRVVTKTVTAKGGNVYLPGLGWFSFDSDQWGNYQQCMEQEAVLEVLSALMVQVKSGQLKPKQFYSPQPR